MEVTSLLDEEHCPGKVLSRIIDPGGLRLFQRFLASRRLNQLEMGLSTNRKREAFKRALRVLDNARPCRSPAQNRELVRMLPLQAPPPSLSPTTIAVEDAFQIATKVKYKLGKELSRICTDLPDVVKIEMLSDSLAQACHMVDREMRMSYRDHYVHPVAVAAFGTHLLAYDADGGGGFLEEATRRLFDGSSGESALHAAATNGVGAVERALRTGELSDDDALASRCAFVLLSWILAATYHDVGRHILTLAMVQASNVCVRDHMELPVFQAYVSKSCFSKRSGKLKRCPCTYPSKRLVDSFERFVSRVFPTMKTLVRQRLRGDLGRSIDGLGFINPGGGDPRIDDHAILSSLELFAWAQRLEAGLTTLSEEARRRRRVLASACYLAAATVLPHHVGAKRDTASMLDDLKINSNPLGVLLRIVDYFHSACRPFLAWPEFRQSGRVLKSFKLQFRLNETATTLLMVPNDSANPIPFTFEMTSRLKYALEDAEKSADKRALLDEIDRRVTRKFRKADLERRNLAQWLTRSRLGAQLVIRT